MEYDFFLLTTFLLQTNGSETWTQLRCIGSREILKTDRDVPKYILGMIEFESSHIPVVDLGSVFGIDSIEIDNSKCILIVEHNCTSGKFFTGFIIPDFEEIMKLAAGSSKSGTEPNACVNISFVLEMQNHCDEDYEILLKSHNAISLLEKPKTGISEDYSGFRFCNLYNFINKITNN